MLGNLNIRTRLTLAFATLLLLICAVAAVGTYQSSKINEAADDLGRNWLQTIKLLGDLRAQVNGVRRATLRHVLEAEVDGKRRQRAIADEVASKEIPKKFAALDKLVNSPEERSSLAKITQLWAAYGEVNAKMISLSDGGDATFTEARTMSTGVSADAFAKVLAAIEEAVALNVAGADRSVELADAAYTSSKYISGVSVLVALAIGVTFGIIIANSINKPIARAVQIASAVADGDLTADFEVKGKDETAQLLAALKRMNTNLARIVGQVRDSSDSVATGSSQISQGNNDLSQRTEEQASALEETAASMEQLSSTVARNTEGARQANQLALGASAVAERGGEVVREVVETMKDIDARSKKIADIISVIDGIAFQTNILALNAAVEAARAGEQGRGFAVVASEVRSLAGRCADAAKEIKSLITASVERVGQGTVLVDKAGDTMVEVVESIKRVTQIMGEITSASIEQSAGVSQVAEAVSQMDQVTQQNAALVEESAAAAESLRSQAQQLVEAVSVFKIRTDVARQFVSSGSQGHEPAHGDRRGHDRAANVVRPGFGAKADPAEGIRHRTGTDGWSAI